MKKLILNILDWQIARNFFGEGGATIESQKLKFFEEYGEYAGHKVRGKDTKDDIGDMMVVCIALLGIREFGKDKEIDMDYLLEDRDRPTSRRIPEYASSDQFYTLFHACKDLAEAEGFTVEECLEQAYSEIKDRKGEFVNGSFIKESDLV